MELPTRKRFDSRILAVSLLVSLLGGCVTLDDAKEVMVNATNTTVDFSKNVFDRSKPHVEKALGQLNALYAQRGAYMSDLFGDPQDNKAAYEELIDSCPEALEPITKAAESTDISANYLLALARQESSCNSMAKASTTTAAGMFQFLEQTWLLSVDSHAGKYGYTEYPERIRIDRRGIASVDQTRMKQVILDKRFDANLAALMAAEFARDNYKYMKRSIPRDLQPTDLYMAHFLGASGATKFLVAMDSSPDTPAANMFPAAARANRSVFYNKSSESRSLGEVHQLFQKKIEKI